MAAVNSKRSPIARVATTGGIAYGPQKLGKASGKKHQPKSRAGPRPTAKMLRFAPEWEKTGGRTEYERSPRSSTNQHKPAQSGTFRHFSV